MRVGGTEQCGWERRILGVGGTEQCGWEVLNNAGGSDGSWGWEVLNNVSARYCTMRVGGTGQRGGSAGGSTE